MSGYGVHRGRPVIDRERDAGDKARMVNGKLESCRAVADLIDETGSSKAVHADGWSRGNIYGSYVHGIFDQEGIAGEIVNELRRKKGLPENTESFDYQAYRTRQYDYLARELRESLDMKQIYRILEEGC